MIIPPRLSPDRRGRDAFRAALACSVLWASVALGQGPAADGDVLRTPAPVAPPAPAVPVRVAPQTIPSDLWGIIIAGGPVMIPIGLCSLIALAIGFERLVMLRRGRVVPRDFVTRFIEHLENGKLERDAALRLCEENGSPVAQIFAHGVRKWGKPSVEVEQSIIDGGERQVSQLRKNLRVINAVATISPLLGLFGTVVGMIMCFNQIASSSAMGKAEQLAGGIGVALITTAAGLAVAIPALIVYMYLIGVVDSLVVDMDLLAQRVVNLISLEGLADPLPSTRTARAKPDPVDKKEVKESRERKPVAT
jgi:biopolymer transport protein ExbB